MALPVDPLFEAYNSILSILETDADFAPLFTVGRRITDTQAGWLARYIRRAPAEFPQIRVELGNGRHAGSAEDPSMACYANSFPSVTPEFADPTMQEFRITLVYSMTDNDTLAHRQKIEWPLLVALRRAGTTLGLNTVNSVGEISETRSGLVMDGKTYPSTTITIPVMFRYDASALS